MNGFGWVILFCFVMWIGLETRLKKEHKETRSGIERLASVTTANVGGDRDTLLHVNELQKQLVSLTGAVRNVEAELSLLREALMNGTTEGPWGS